MVFNQKLFWLANEIYFILSENLLKVGRNITNKKEQDDSTRLAANKVQFDISDEDTVIRVEACY